jgi:hypothetical protein
MLGFRQRVLGVRGYGQPRRCAAQSIADRVFVLGSADEYADSGSLPWKSHFVVDDSDVKVQLSGVMGSCECAAGRYAEVFGRAGVLTAVGEGERRVPARRRRQRRRSHTPPNAPDPSAILVSGVVNLRLSFEDNVSKLGGKDGKDDLWLVWG